MNRKKWLIIAAAAVLIAGLAGWWFLRRGNSGGGETAYVQRISTLNGGGVMLDRYAGVVESQQTADYKMDSGRTIETVFVKPGKTVNETGLNAEGMEAPVVTVAEIGEFRVKGKVSEQSVGMFYEGMGVFVRSRVNENQVWRGEISSVSNEPELFVSSTQNYTCR